MAGDEPLLKMCGTVPGHVHAVTHIVLYSLNTFSSILMEGNFREYWRFMSHSQMLGKFEYGGGPIFKVVIEC